MAKIRQRGVIGKPTVLVDGFVRGTWKLTRPRGEALVAAEILGKLSPADRRAVVDAGERLAAFLARGDERPLFTIVTGK